MAMDIISKLPSIAPVPLSPIGTEKTTESVGSSFSSFLSDAINQVSSQQMDAQKARDDLAAGISDNIQDVMIKAEKSSITMQYALAVRNKIMDAYTEIMRITL